MFHGESKIEGVLRKFENDVRASFERMMVDGKRMSSVETVAFCIDWRLCGEKGASMRSQLSETIASFREAGLYISEFSALPWIDVCAVEIDNSDGFQAVKRQLNVHSPVLYLGDAEVVILPPSSLKLRSL